MDIDYMDRYIDFTVNPKRFPDLKGFSQAMAGEGIHLVPIIDAGVKVEPGNEVYEEGVENGYFCTNAKGEPFSAAVWPGMTHFPDFFQPKAREWFGSKYKALTDCGIEGYWNDMNEPAIFYSECSKKKTATETVMGFLSPAWAEKHASEESNAYQDYKHFYHNINGQQVLHHRVHNLYGGFMTMADNEGLTKLLDHRFLLYSRASYIGAHRYGGIWTGDNASTWELLRTNVCQMPSLNMCGFLYTGADTGGFGGNCSRELLLRWLAFSDFTPLMRNHSSIGTRRQECYQFGDTEDFRRIVNLRYRLLPYIYSEFIKAALRSEMYMRPLTFDFPEDEVCRGIEDQLMVGESIMIAPVLTQGAKGRSVYLPEDMQRVRFNGESFETEEWKAGKHEVLVDVNEVVFFIRHGHCVPVANAQVQTTRDLVLEDVTLLGDGNDYEQYADDGLTRQVSPERIRRISK
jgi:alpha-glucosidase